MSEFFNKGYSNFEDSASLPRHRWYAFKEGFSPRLVDYAIDNAGLKKGSHIIDPFSGSGTVAVAAALRGFHSTGLEVNPFLAFVGQAKLLQAGKVALSTALPIIRRGIARGRRSELESLSSFSRAGGRDRWLFNEAVLRAFEGGWVPTRTLNQEVRTLVRLALIGAAMDSCNATPDGKCLRYRPDWGSLNFNREYFSDAFDSRIELIRADLDETPAAIGKGAVIRSDARTPWLKGKVEKFDLCVTSPPYLNSFDYSDIYRPELFLGKFVASNAALRKVRLATVRSHVQVNWESPENLKLSDILESAIGKIREREGDLWNHRIPMMIQAYFEDMNSVLMNLKSRAKSGAQLWLVVSTSAYAGVEIPVDLIMADLAARIGWRLRDIRVLRDLRAAGQQWNGQLRKNGKSAPLRESLLIFSSTR